MTIKRLKYYVSFEGNKYSHEVPIYAKDLDTALNKALLRFKSSKYQVTRVRPDDLYNSSIKNNK